MPMMNENTTVAATMYQLMKIGTPDIFEMPYASPMPTSTPRMPPRQVSTPASIRNCAEMRRLRAPSAFLRPISGVRSVTDTSMMFITPMPPTMSEMPATRISWRFVALESSCRFFACSKRSSLL